MAKNSEAPNSPKKLYRSSSDRMIAGVCGGLAEYFELDSSILRLVFLIMFLFGGAGFLFYLVLWIILPQKTSVHAEVEEVIKENMKDIRNKAEKMVGKIKEEINTDDSLKEKGSKQTGALILIGLGLFFLLKNFSVFEFIDLGRFWPVLLILLGIMILTKRI